MNKAFEKILERLEEYKNAELLREDNVDENGIYNDCEDAYDDGESNGRYQMCVRLLKFVNELAEEYNNGWIPCSEQLPEQPKENMIFENKQLELYLVTVKNTKYALRAFWNGKHFTDGWGMLDVIAWQPLPEPYKE